MKIETLEKIVEKLKNISKKSTVLYENDIDLFEYNNDFFIITDLLIKEVFDEESCDWFDWYCFENNFGEGGLQAYDKDGKEICKNIKELHKLLIKK